MQEQHIKPPSDSQDTVQNQAPKYFYARKVTGQGMLFSALALVVLVWLYFTQPEFSILEKAAVVFFIFIFVMNAVQYMRPYIIIGADYIRMHARNVPLESVTRYTTDDKFFVVQFKEVQGEKGQAVETAIVIRLNMIKEEERNKLVFALREAMLKTKAHE